MNRLSLKITSALAAASLVCGLGGASMYAYATGGEQKKENTGNKVSTSEEESNRGMFVNMPKAVDKEETVYVISGPEGDVRKVIVSDKLANPESEKEIEDASSLSGIANVKGYEEFTTGAQGNLQWKADGKEIYYSGTSSKELPVAMTVTYFLDGKEISSADLAGKSGKVEMVYDFIGKEKAVVDVNGKKVEATVPFLNVTGMLLDSDVFANVTVKNGRVISDGNRNIVVGWALTGISPELEKGLDKIELPTQIVVSADVKNFAMGMTVTLATNEVFGTIDTEKFDIIREYRESLTELEAGMKALVNGSEDLSKGANQVNEGAKTLDAGLASISANSEMLNAGAKQVFESLLASAEAQITAAGVQIPQLTIENYQTVFEAIEASLGAAGVSSPVGQKLMGAKASLDSYNTFYNGLAAYTAGVAKAEEGAAKLAEGTESLKNGAATLSAGIAKFDEEGVSKIMELVNGKAAELSEAIMATVEASKTYYNYSGIAEGKTGNVKFIIKTTEIK